MTPNHSQNYHNKEQDRRLSKMEGHIEVINGELGDVKTKLAKVSTDVSWLKKTYWIVVSASVGALIAGLINILIRF